jgi:hypothetical protein
MRFPALKLFLDYVAILSDAVFANQAIATRAPAAKLHWIALGRHKRNPIAMPARKGVLFQRATIRIDDNRISARFPKHQKSSCLVSTRTLFV